MNRLKHPAFGLLLLRLTLGGLILLHGIDKINHPGSLQLFSSQLVHAGLPGELSYAVYLTELLAPLMLIIGWRCRLGALLLVGNMLLAIGVVHSNELMAFNRNGGWALELQGMYLAAALALFFSGSGWLAFRPD